MFCFRDLTCLLITLLCFDPFFTLLCLSHIDRSVRLCPFLKWGEGQWICSWSPRRWFVGPWSCSNPDITSACSACRQRRPAGHVMPVSVWPIVLLQFASAPLARLLLSSVIVDQDSTLPIHYSSLQSNDQELPTNIDKELDYEIVDVSKETCSIPFISVHHSSGVSPLTARSVSLCASSLKKLASGTGARFQFGSLAPGRVGECPNDPRGLWSSFDWEGEPKVNPRWQARWHGGTSEGTSKVPFVAFVPR